MHQPLQRLLAQLLGQYISWIDKKGRSQRGIIREVKRDHLVVESEQYGATPPERKRVPIDAAEILEDTREPAEELVSHSITKETNFQWRWEIRIAGEPWRRRRGFKSRRTANESLQKNMDEALAAARNLRPSPEAIAAKHLFGSDFTKSGLGPQDFFEQLTPQRKELCRALTHELCERLFS
jgi:hypothetical protein